MMIIKIFFLVTAASFNYVNSIVGSGIIGKFTSEIYCLISRLLWSLRFYQRNKFFLNLAIILMAVVLFEFERLSTF